MRTLMKIWIRFFDVHGRCHNRSRHISLKAMINQGVGC